mmetsp:Transcript_10768/g.34161  ORF Transcript_10768/g.34161 Transcript_10768/m.34161 type:complete len:161 (-) Transcript_10768:150-632(-)
MDAPPFMLIFVAHVVLALCTSVYEYSVGRQSRRQAKAVQQELATLEEEAARLNSPSTFVAYAKVNRRKTRLQKEAEGDTRMLAELARRADRVRSVGGWLILVAAWGHGVCFDQPWLADLLWPASSFFTFYGWESGCIGTIAWASLSSRVGRSIAGRLTGC